MKRARWTLLGVTAVTFAIAARPATPPAVHIVRLNANRFAPHEIRVAPGDTIRFVNGMGGPHNVQFIPDSIAPAARALLDAAMKDRIGPLASPMFILEEETYVLVVPDLPAGRYPFLCNPHWANMRGALVVTR